MTSIRRQLSALIEQRVIPDDKIGEALRISGLLPDGRSWRLFLDRLLLWLGGLALAFSVMFFIAYNWHDIDRFAKFGLIEGLLVLTIAAYYLSKKETTAAKVSLTSATIILGVLLGFYGQTYQTGADPWQLFFTWGLMILPWAAIGRFAAIWLIWLILMNLSIVQYYRTFPGSLLFLHDPATTIFWLTFAFNSLSLAIWELLRNKLPWLSENWAIRLIASGSGISITWLVLDMIVTDRNVSFLAPLLWFFWLTIMYFAYRKARPELFMLAGCCLSAITVIITFTARHILKGSSAPSFLLLALLVIGLGSGAAFWLKTVQREIRS